MTNDVLEGDTPTIPAGLRAHALEWGFGRQIGPLYQKNDTAGNYARAFLVSEHHTNGMNNCHGGMLMAFADTAFGHAVSMRRRNHYWVTVRLLTDFLAPAMLGDWVEGTGEIAGVDDDLFTVRGRIWCGDRTIMTGNGIFKALGPRPSRR